MYDSRGIFQNNKNNLIVTVVVGTLTLYRIVYGKFQGSGGFL